MPIFYSYIYKNVHKLSQEQCYVSLTEILLQVDNILCMFKFSIYFFILVKVE